MAIHSRPPMVYIYGTSLWPHAYVLTAAFTVVIFLTHLTPPDDWIVFAPPDLCPAASF